MNDIIEPPYKLFDYDIIRDKKKYSKIDLYKHLILIILGLFLFILLTIFSIALSYEELDDSKLEVEKTVQTYEQENDSLRQEIKRLNNRVLYLEDSIKELNNENSR